MNRSIITNLLINGIAPPNFIAVHSNAYLQFLVFKRPCNRADSPLAKRRGDFCQYPLAPQITFLESFPERNASWNEASICSVANRFCMWTLHASPFCRGMHHSSSLFNLNNQMKMATNAILEHGQDSFLLPFPKTYF
jgi:hypothetical protein